MSLPHHRAPVVEALCPCPPNSTPGARLPTVIVSATTIGARLGEISGTVNQLTLQPFVTKLLPDAWYVQMQPIILDFVKGTSSVRVNLDVGKLFAGPIECERTGE